ncbi:MAG TPA: DUF4149 domain-containing protein [Candidatus Acidoferrum sp.]|nr:DUF4149 domain-containing protein [Candidatus Acidoferrum sp.]
MVNLFRALEFLGLSVWLGSDIFLSFVVAPGAFRVLAPNRDQAGAVVGFALTKMHLIGIACGVAMLLLRLLRTKSVANPAALCVFLMIVLTVVSQIAVTPKMAALRTQMGSIQATAAESPLLADFAKLHQVSVTLESGVLIAGIVCMYFMVKELGRS